MVSDIEIAMSKISYGLIAFAHAELSGPGLGCYGGSGPQDCRADYENPGIVKTNAARTVMK